MRDSNTPPLWLQVPEPHDLVRRFGTAVDVPAFGGRLEVDWSPGERVTSVGGLVYFATFLKETGRFDRLCEDFPIKPGRPSRNYHSFFIGKVAAFFRWLKSTAEHLDEKTRWYVILRCAFRKLLMPEQPLGAVIPIQ